MELESKNPELTQTSLHEDSESHQANPDPQFAPIPEDFNLAEKNTFPLDSTNEPTHSMSASTNFDEMPISSKSNLTFEQMIEANLKASGFEAPEPSVKQSSISRPPKPKSVPKFVRGANSRPQSQTNMEEEAVINPNDPAQLEPSSSNNQISPSEETGSEQVFNAPEDIIVARKNSSTSMHIEEEKPKKVSQPGSAEPVKRRVSGDIMVPEIPREDRIQEENVGSEQNFDEVPVGKTGGMSAFNISAYPEGQEGMEESNMQSQDMGPLQNRIKSKVWKVRQTAFEELAQKFKDAEKEDYIFDEYIGELPKLLGDSNPGAQEKAIEAFKVYLEKRGGGGVDGKSVIKNLIDKALAPGKPNIKKITLEVICLMFENIEKKEIMDGVIDSINHKNQKVSCAAVQASVELLTSYGPRKLDFLKPFFPPIEKLAASTVSSQRSEAMNFYKEAYKYMGDALKPFIVNLKKAQTDELEKFFSECPSELAKPSKADASEVEMGGISGGPARSGSGALDVYEIADAVDLFKKYNDGWADKVLAQAKWNERKAMLDDLLKEANNTPKIAANGHFSHMTNLLKKVLNDSNQQVMLTGIKIYAALAKGLRKNLANGCKNIMPTILAKLKDKKNVMEETMRTMENFLYCIGPEDVIDDVQTVLADKAHIPKVQVLKWIEKYYEKNSKTPEKLVSLYRSLLPTFKKLIEDGSAEVREQIVLTLARIKFILTDSVIKETLNDINPSKLARINELTMALADGRGIDDSSNKMGSSMIMGTMPAPRRKPNLSLSENIEEEKSGSVKRSTSRTMEHEAPKVGGNRPQTSKAAGAKQFQQQGLKKVGSQKTLATQQDNSANKEREDSVSHISAEDAEMKMQELNVPEGIVKGLDNPAWKERQKALEEFSMFVRENASTVGPCIEYVFKYIRAKLKDWKESNLSVVKEAFNTISSITETPEIPLTKRAFYVISPFIINNLHDSKYTESCTKIVTSFVETISPKFVIMQLVGHFLEASKDTKTTAKVNPKALTEVSNLFVKLLDILTLNYFPLKDTIDFSKMVLSNQNIQARNAAISLLKSIYQQLGPPLNDFLNDVNPQTLKMLNAEFEKIVPNKDVQCKVQFRGEAQSDLKDQGSSGNANPLDSLPRVDISKDVDKLLKKLGDSKWEVRKEALEALSGLLTASHNRIAATGLQELVTALKGRLNDNNKSFLKSCLMFVGNFATAVGPNVRIYAKPLIQELVKNLLDKQAAIRNETIISLDKFANEVGSETVMNIAFPLLNQENPELRQTFIPWILKNQDGLSKVDLRAHIGVVLSILQDKIKDIRILGERLLEKCIGVIGTGPYLTALKDLKPAIQKALTPIVQKYSGTSNSGGVVMTEPDLDSDGGNNSSLELKLPGRTLNKTPSESALRGVGTNTMKPQHKPGSTSMIQESSGNKKGGRPTTPNGSMSNIQINIPPVGGSTGTGGPNSSRSGMIYVMGLKGKRQEDEKKNKWNTEDLRDDMVEKLKENIKKNVSTELSQKMFSFDARKQIEAIQCLKKCLTQELQGTVDILDLIIRWIFFKLWDNSNMQIAKEALDYVYNLVLTLESSKTSLEDFEVNVLVPFLLQRLVQGHSNTKTTIYKIFQKLGEVAYVQKISAMLVQNAQSKNTRMRDEALEVITVVTKEYKAETLSAKDIRTLGKMLGHTDAIVRNHCLNIFTELGLYMKDDLFRTLKGEAPQKALDTLMQRIKSAEGGNRFERRGQSDDFSVSMYDDNIFSGGHKGPSVVSSSFIHDKENAYYDMENVENRDIGNFNKFSGVGGGSKMGISTVESKESMRDTRDTSLLGTPQTKTKSFHVVGGQKIEEELFDRNLNSLVSGSMSSRLDALLLIHDIVVVDNEETREFLKIKADDLINALYVTLKNVFEKPKQEVPLKFAFYFLNMTHKLCSIRAFLKNVTEDNLKRFGEELLQRLLAEDEEKRFDHTDNENLVKTLNAIMLRVLENAEADDMFNVLFDLLIKNRRIHSYAKILGLIVKCILKLTKALNQLVPTLHPETLLIKFHLYILEFGAVNTEDIGIKTIKTLLNELVKVYQESIWNSYAKSVQTHPKPDQVLHSWITVILRHINGGKDDQPQDFSGRVTPDRRESGDLNNFKSIKRESGFNQSIVAPIETNTSMSMYQSQIQPQPQIQSSSDNYEIKQLIENIRLSNDLEGGIKQLHTALKKYPGLSLTPYLLHSTPAFSEYIYKALERLDNREKTQSREDFRSQGSFQTTTDTSNKFGQDLTSRIKLDEENYNKPSVGLSQEVISPRATNIGTGAGSTTLSLEDFQNKVNTLKLRYGLILKKGNETQEPAAKPSQTTMVYRTAPTSQLPERTERRDPSREKERESVAPKNEQKEISPYENKGRDSLNSRFGGYSPALSNPEGTTASLGFHSTTGGNNMGMFDRPVLSEQNTRTEVIRSNSTISEGNSGASSVTGTSGARSTESILQRLSEMKMKMASIVNSNKGGN